MTGAGRYVLSRSVCFSPASHSSCPAASISANVTPSTPSVRAACGARDAADVDAIHLVVERPLKSPNALGSLQAHANPLVLDSVRRTQKRGSFPPSALAGLSGTISLSDAHAGHDPGDRVEPRNRSPAVGFPRCPENLSHVPSQYAGGPRPVRVSVASPSYGGLPRCRVATGP